MMDAIGADLGDGKRQMELKQISNNLQLARPPDIGMASDRLEVETADIGDE